MDMDTKKDMDMTTTLHTTPMDTQYMDMTRMEDQDLIILSLSLGLVTTLRGVTVWTYLMGGLR